MLDDGVEARETPGQISLLDREAGADLARFPDPLAFGSGSGLQCVYTVVISL